MITFTRTGPTSFRASGMSIAIPVGAWVSQLFAAANRLQIKIADAFRVQRVAGTRWLLPATNPQYIKWKQRTVGHNRRGHLFEGIQTVLDTTQLWTVGPLTGSKAYAARVNMSEKIFREQLIYIRRYEATKVPGGRILHLADSWIRAEEAKLREWEAMMLGEVMTRQTSRSGRGIPLARGKREQIQDVLRRANIRVTR